MKIIAIMSHGLRRNVTRKVVKFILYLEVCAANVADATGYEAARHTLTELLIKGAFLLGDHAFHRCMHILCPYTDTEIRVGVSQIMNQYNTVMSSDRMCSEHAMMYLKVWGIIRGRDDIRLFEDEQLYLDTVDVVWALHNFQALGCPTN